MLLLPRGAPTRLGAPLLVVALCAAVGCGDDPQMATSGNATTPGPPPTTGATATGSGTVGPITGGMSTAGGGACQASAPGATPPCFCAGEHVSGQTSPPEDGACQPACVPDGFVSLWCLDDAACCSGSCDLPTGFCTGGAVTSTTGTGDTGTSTSTGG